MIEQRLRGHGKIVELAELGRLVAQRREAGAAVVHCHGVFDLLHVGHIRHLHEARSLGDLLVVTLTADRFVNKGPHRPMFTDALRAEAIAALDAVDYVAISHRQNAVEAIELLRPDVYVKGPDYKAAADDISGGIGREEAAVRAGGGRLHVTEDITFSSSALLNRAFPAFPDATEAYLSALRDRYSAREVSDAIEGLGSLRAVVIGEAILDEYIYCDQMGKSAKEPVLAMRYADRELYAGGSLAVANHVASFCKSVELVTYLGNHDAQEDFVRRNLKPNVRSSFIYKNDSPTIVKRRFIERYLLQKLFEVYEINDEPVDESQAAQFCELLEARLANAEVAVVADFGHGLLTAESVRLLAEQAAFLAVNTQINAANIGFHAISKYPRADYICIHEGEVRMDSRNRRSPLGELIPDLSARLSCPRVLVTRGKAGVSYFERGAEHTSPALASSVVDRIGSGDAVLALTALCVQAGLPPDLVAFIANVAGAQKLQIVGNKLALDKVATLKFITSLLK